MAEHRQKTLPFQSLGGFRLIAEIGRGASGTVYSAVQESLRRPVAVKVLSQGVTLEEKTVARFHREAEALARIRHRNIVPVYHVGFDQSVYYYAMELVSGRDVQTILRDEGRLPPESAARIIRDAADALQCAHERGVIHRDIKPANLILDADGQVKITDFGLAKVDHGGTITESGTLIGTPMYMSPEQAMGNRSLIGPACDVYSLGATLYEMTTGRPLFSSDSFQAILRMIVEVDPLPPRRVCADIPRDLETIILRALNKEPGKRYPSAVELAADLDRFVRNEPIRARRSTWVDTGLRRLRRNRRLVVLVVPILLLLLAAIATMYLFGLSDRYLLELQNGRIEAFSRNYEAALQCFERAKKLRPRRGDAYLWEGKVFDDMGRTEDARRAFDQGVGLSPASVDMLRARAEFSFDHREFEEAEADYARILELQPEDALAMAKSARILYHYNAKQRGLPGARNQALELAQAVLARDSAPPTARIEALRLVALDHLESALDHLDRSRPYEGDLEQARETLQAAKDLDPLDPETDRLLFRVLDLKRSSTAQQENLVRLLQWFNPLEERLDFTRVEDGVERSLEALQSGIQGAGVQARNLLGLFRGSASSIDPGDASEASLDDLDERIRVDPNDCSALLARGRLLERTGSLRAAERDYRSAADHCKNAGAAYYLLGRLYAESSDPDVRDLDQADRFAHLAVAAQPLETAHLELLLRVYLTTNRLEEARNFFRRFFREHPEHPDRERLEKSLGIF